MEWLKDRLIILRTPWPSGFTLHVKHLEKFPIVFGGLAVSMNIPPRKKEGSSQGPIILRMPWPKCGAHCKNQWIFVDFIYLFIYLSHYTWWVPKGYISHIMGKRVKNNAGHFKK
jgi:hypothetical protein